MSEVAGRMSVQEGAKYLEKPLGGRGILLGGVPGVKPANVVVLGGGIVGTQAAKMAAGLGAQVTIMDISIPRLRQLDDIMPANVQTLYSNTYNIKEAIKQTIANGEGQTIWMKSVGVNEKREQVSEMNFEWSIKLKA